MSFKVSIYNYVYIEVIKPSISRIEQIAYNYNI